MDMLLTGSLFHFEQADLPKPPEPEPEQKPAQVVVAA